MEHAIGTRITLEVVEANERSCEGCFFGSGTCKRPFGWECTDYKRTDNKSIIYKEVKEG